MKWFRQSVDDAPQNCPKYVYFFGEFHTFPVTEGHKIQHIYFQFMTPARKLTHNTKFERHEFWECHNYSSPWAREMPKIWPRKTQISGTPWLFVTLGQRNAKNPTQKDMNFGNTMIICHLGPEKCQKSNPERHEFWETALIDPSKKMPTNKESIRFSRILHLNWNALINPIHTNQPITFGTPSSTFSLVADQLWYIWTVVP